MKGSECMPFLITTKEEMVANGIEQFDFVYISGDAYVDHPSWSRYYYSYARGVWI